MKKILFLINPISGSSPGPILERRIRAGLQGILPTDRFDTSFTEPDIKAQARKLAPHYEIMVGVGGDGTFGGIMQAVVGMPRVPKLGIIPYGVGNDLSRSLGMYTVLKKGGIKKALEVILHEKTAAVDLLEVNGEYLCAGYFGAGNDAMTSNRFNEIRPRATRPILGTQLLINNTLYSLLALKNLKYKIPFPMQMKFRDKQGRYRLLSVPRGVRAVLITNTSIYAGGAIISSRTDMSDGMFEVTILSKLRHWLTMLSTRLFKKPLEILRPEIIQFQTDQLQVLLKGNTFYQLDGEKPGQSVTGEKGLHFRISGKARIIVP